MKKGLLITLLFTMFTFLGYTQTDKYWTAHIANTGKIATDKAVARSTFAKEFKLFEINFEPLRQELNKTVNNISKHTTIITLPNAVGQLETFEVFEASNFEPDLQAKFPQIRAFSGKGITDKYATLKLSISPQGIQTMVFRTDKENEFIEAYSQDHTIYAVFKSQRNKGQLPWSCSTNDHDLMNNVNAKLHGSNISNSTASSTGELKTMRLAQSCNGEYANYFGATSAAQVSLVLAAYNATLTRCNGVYEKDLALHLNLISNTTAVIFYDPASDPYTTTLSDWNLQLQKTLTAIIGEANYDIGHMFGASGGGGNAGCIGCVCVSPPVNGSGVPTDNGKGSGITSPADGIPQGDNFDIDYVVHEVGHQLGANHTFSFSSEGTGVNKEIGSGITIMGYAGITPQNVAPHSIDIFHQASIAQIQANLSTKSCPVTTLITANNATPVVAPVGNYTIPISTPFMLTGAATDANAADALTYCWEQNDNTTTTGNASAASITKTTGPNFVSFSPTASPLRYFPRYASILANSATTVSLPGGTAGFLIEALSSVGRILNFRLTVRDNSAYSSTAPIKVGQTAYTDMKVTVDAASGPFQVTAPNTNVSYVGGSTQTITWDVKNTNAAPVNCANVKISYSTDGGLTFPTVLSASTPNDGTESLVIPVGVTTMARIKIEAVGNIFFDISNTNFNVVNSDFNFTPSSPTTFSCGATSGSVSIATTSTNGFTTPITLTASGVPAGATLTFVPNPITAGNSTVATLNITSLFVPGTYDILVTGTAGVVVKATTIRFIVYALVPIITLQPLAQSGCALTNYTFSVAASTGNGNPTPNYQWQDSTSAATSFKDILGATSATYTINNAALSLNGNSYRVVISGAVCNSVKSSSVLLKLSAKSIIALTAPATSSTNPALNATLLASVTPASASLVYTWKRNDVIIPNSSASKIITLNIDDEATYSLFVVETTGCTSDISTISTTAKTSDNLEANKIFIYPNPVKTIMQLRFNNSSATDKATMVNMYDEKGTKVFQKSYTINATLGRMDIDMTRMQNGIYMVYLMDKMGKKLAGAKVVKIN